jgi:hypothetical protein
MRKEIRIRKIFKDNDRLTAENEVDNRKRIIKNNS